jgi:uncharacterized protein YhaN
MRIKEINLQKYGPLVACHFNKLGGFNLFWGENEEGKTLIIEALVKILFGKKAKEFPGIDRVEEFPEGYVVLEIKPGQEIILPQEGNLSQLFDISAAEGKNIFIIRNSELALSREREGEFRFYTEFTDRLLGLQTQKLKRIKTVLQKMGRLSNPTSKAILSSSKEAEFIQKRVTRARELIKEIEELQAEIEEEGLADLEKTLASQRENYERVKTQLNLLEKARLRDLYRQGKKALDELQESFQALKDLPGFSDELKQTWIETQKSLELSRKELYEERRQLQEKQRLLALKEEEWRKKQAERNSLEEKRTRVRTQLEELIENYQEKLARQEKDEAKLPVFYRGTWVSLALALLPALAWMKQPNIIFGLISLVGVTGFLCCAGMILVIRSRRGRLRALWVKLAQRAAGLGFAATSLQELMPQLARLEAESTRLERELVHLEGNRKNLVEYIQGLQKKIEEREELIAQEEAIIKNLQQESGVSSLEEFEEKSRFFKHHQSIVDRNQAFLKHSFGQKTDGIASNLVFWEEKIKALSRYGQEAEGIVYSNEEKAKLEEELSSLEEKIAVGETRLADLRQRLSRLEDKVNNEVQLSSTTYYRCGTIVEMLAIKEKLQEFIRTVEENKQLVCRVIEIFEDIESEEREKITFLFGDKSQVAQYYKTITGNRYHSVEYNREQMTLMVKTKDGQELRASQLSSGAYDQLYFAVRLALGEKMFEEEKAFFILDDPFVKSDPRRLLLQLNLLRKIVEMGWQVFYFSAKGEVKEALEKDIKAKQIKYFSV